MGPSQSDDFDVEGGVDADPKHHVANERDRQDQHQAAAVSLGERRAPAERLNRPGAFEDHDRSQGDPEQAEHHARDVKEQVRETDCDVGQDHGQEQGGHSPGIAQGEALGGAFHLGRRPAAEVDRHQRVREEAHRHVDPLADRWAHEGRRRAEFERGQMPFDPDRGELGREFERQGEDQHPPPVPPERAEAPADHPANLQSRPIDDGRRGHGQSNTDASDGAAAPCLSVTSSR